MNKIFPSGVARGKFCFMLSRFAGVNVARGASYDPLCGVKIGFAELMFPLRGKFDRCFIFITINTYQTSPKANINFGEAKS